MARDLGQLDMFAVLEPPPPLAPVTPERVVDRMVERCVSLGLVHNEYLFSLNGVMVPYEWTLEGVWALPSRLFRHPFEHQDGRYLDDGQSRLYLRSPLLKAHPFVQHVERQLGVEFSGTETDSFGRTVAGVWWHACDLMNEKRWRDLLDTRQFTDDRSIAAAVEHALGSKGQLSIATARKVLAEIGVTEPADRSRGLLLSDRLGLSSPSKIEERDGKGKVTSSSWPVNLHSKNSNAGAWAMIHAIEDGWFAYRGSYIGWTETGRARRAGNSGELL